MYTSSQRIIAPLTAIIFSLILGLFVNTGTVVRAPGFTTVGEQSVVPFGEAIVSNNLGSAFTALENQFPEGNRPSSAFSIPSSLIEPDPVVLVSKYILQVKNRFNFAHRNILFPTHYFL